MNHPRKVEMNRAERRPIEREQKKQSIPNGQWSAGPAAQQDTLRVFAMKDCEHLTAELIEQLADRGWPQQELANFHRQGGHYCRPRDSVIFPTPEFLSGAPAEEVLSAVVRETTFEQGKLLDHYHSLGHRAG